jgi:hypothetical protein
VYLIFPIFLAIVTSLVVSMTLRGNQRHPSHPDFLLESINALFQCIGAFALFLAMNLALGLAIILTIRSVTPHFMTVYELENPVLIAFSAVQAFVFQRWWKTRK